MSTIKKTRINCFISILLVLIIASFGCNKKETVDNTILIERTYYPDGTIESITSFVGSKKEGYFAYFDNNGILFMDGIIINNKMNGKCITYYNGKKFIEENRTDDISNGETIFYYLNGNIREKGIIINGKEDGRYEFYTEDGKLAKIKEYKDGVLITEHEYIKDYDEDDWSDIDGCM